MMIVVIEIFPSSFRSEEMEGGTGGEKSQRKNSPGMKRKETLLSFIHSVIHSLASLDLSKENKKQHHDHQAKKGERSSVNVT